jgi:tRNA-(guanine-N1)-methyltransferase
MVMKVEPVFKAVEELKMETPNAECRTSNAEQKAIDNRKPKVILMSPAGRRFDQSWRENFRRNRI